MLQFFTKKEFLVDHLDGFIDIHNHILPGIDDGAKNVKESIAIIKAFGEFGVTDFVCTPHIMHNYYENTKKTISKAFKELEEELADTELSIAINYAAEHMIDDNFEHLFEENEALPLGEQHILVEMSYLQPSINFDSSIGKILDKQVFPVLAHPERYGYLHNDFSKYIEYKNRGIKFQLNMLSILGYYGKGIQKCAQTLLNENMFDYISSDAHNLRHVSSLKEGKVSSKLIQQIKPLLLNTIQDFKKI